MKEVELVKVVQKRLSFLRDVPFLPAIFDEQLKVYTRFFRPKIHKKMLEYSNIIKGFNCVTTSAHKYGGMQFNIKNKEIGHMHGDGLVDIRLNKKIAKVIICLGLAEEHHVLKDSGWISFPINRKAELNILVKITEVAYALRKGEDPSKTLNALVL